MSLNNIVSVFTDPVKIPQNPFVLMGKLNTSQWLIFIAAFLSWALLSMDYYIFNILVSQISEGLITPKAEILSALTGSNAARAIGSLFFGVLGDRYGCKGPLIFNVLLYSLVHALTGISPNIGFLIGMRIIFGFCMGGNWGLGAALTLTNMPVECRGLFSGIYQQGFAFGNLMASALIGVIQVSGADLGWRNIFYIGAIPALLTIFIQFKVPDVKIEKDSKGFYNDFVFAFKTSWQQSFYCCVLMSVFQILSHATQDLYPTFLHDNFGAHTVAAAQMLSGVGGFIGGATIGYIGQYVGRRRAMICSILCAGVMIYPWAFGTNILSIQIAAFFMQFFVAGAWGVVPVYLTEISPAAVRATFPGLAKNIGGLVASGTAQLQTAWAEKIPIVDSNGSLILSEDGKARVNYPIPMAVFTAICVILLVVLVAVGSENHGAALGEETDDKKRDIEQISRDLKHKSAEAPAKLSKA